MAFFKHWSSDRLSLSLSVVAVISATITFYYQFFYYQSDLAVRFTGCHYVPSDSSETITFGLSGVFINSGTTPLTLVENFGFLSTDTTRKQGFTGWAEHVGDVCSHLDWLSTQGKKTILIPGQSTKDFSLSWEVSEPRLRRNIENAKAAWSRAGRPANWGNDGGNSGRTSCVTNDQVVVHLGMHAEFINPMIESSSISVYPVQLLFDFDEPLVDSVRHRKKEPNFFLDFNKVFRLASFEHLEVQ